MEDDRFQFGDIIATRSNSLLSRAIRCCMKKYRPSKETFSHIAVVINMWGKLWIAEALIWGVRIWSLEQSGYSTKKQVIILRHKQSFTTLQIEAISKKMASLGGTRYQYENLPQWAVKILLKINIFKSKNEKAIYCAELGAIAINEAYPETFTTPNMTATADHYLNKIYNIIDINNILNGID
jgi:hypothetical protein